ncbi:hypothetical protein D018_2984A, partial [Vibrio parahaemolyticus VP2007-007]
MHRNLPITL